LYHLSFFSLSFDDIQPKLYTFCPAENIRKIPFTQANMQHPLPKDSYPFSKRIQLIWCAAHD